MNIAIAPLVSRDMEQIGRLVIFDDVTDRAELERRLVQADKLSSIGLLAAGVAHEVNTPLAVISTYAQMLAKQVADDEQKSRMLEKIARQTFRASEIVNSLLNFSRTSTSELTEVQLNRVIQETLSLLEHQMKKAAIEVRMNLDPQLDPVKGNAGKLQQVFLNLFLNARDAMEPRGVLEVVTTRAGENGVEVDVIDTGHGIAPEHLSRIYDPFFTTKSAKKGHRAGAFGDLRHYSGTRRRHRSDFAAWGGYMFPSGISGDQQSGSRLMTPARDRMHRHARKAAFWSSTTRSRFARASKRCSIWKAYEVDLAPNAAEGERKLESARLRSGAARSDDAGEIRHGSAARRARARPPHADLHDHGVRHGGSRRAGGEARAPTIISPSPGTTKSC